jgi:hypothetical protein
VSTRIRPYELILIAGTLELSVKIHPAREYTYVTIANEGYAHSATIYHNRPLIQAHTELHPETPESTPSPHTAPEPPSDTTLVPPIFEQLQVPLTEENLDSRTNSPR